MKTFRFGILGAGNIAHKFCAAVRLLENVEVAAVASRSMERAAAFAQQEGIAAAYDSYERMLTETRPDCVYIATVVSQHELLARLCVEHGIPVLCEKAMFPSYRQAEDFFRWAQEKRVFAMEALWSRFLPANAEAKRCLLRGEIGEPTCIEAAIGFTPPFDPSSRYFSKALGGGAACDLSVYAYELATWMADRPAVSCHVETVWGPTGVDVTDTALLRLEGDLPVQTHCTLVSPIREHLTIHGTEGTLVIPTPHYASGFECRDASGKLRTAWHDDKTVNGFTYEIEETVRCIRKGKTESAVVPWKDTLACAAFIDQILDRSS